MLAMPVGEIYIHGAWTAVKFENGTPFLVLERLWDDYDGRIVVELVSLENAYRFKFRTTAESVDSLCDVIRREFNPDEAHGRVNA